MTESMFNVCLFYVLSLIISNIQSDREREMT